MPRASTSSLFNTDKILNWYFAAIVANPLHAAMSLHGVTTTML